VSLPRTGTSYGNIRLSLCTPSNVENDSMTASKFLTASAGLSALALAACLTPSAAVAAPAGTGLSSLGAVDTQLVQQVGWRGRGGYYRGRGYGYRGYGYRGYGYRNGGAVAAGVIGGLALGAAIAGAAAAPPPVAYAPGGGADWIAYCSSKYRSFNPATGLYLGYDGQYHPCQ
jgi:hypothetical protein